MASVNRVILVGNLGRDPEIRSTASGSAVATLSVATSEKAKEQIVTEWHKVIVFGAPAEFASKYLRKGSQVYVEGRIRTNEWTKDGQRHRQTEIMCDRLTSMDSKSSPGVATETAPAFATTDNDIPF